MEEGGVVPEAMSHTVEYPARLIPRGMPLGAVHETVTVLSFDHVEDGGELDRLITLPGPL
jgi:hypothetical protein